VSHRLTLIFVALLALTAAIFASATRHSTSSEEGSVQESYSQSAPTLPSRRRSAPPMDTNFAELAQKALDALPRIESIRASGVSVHQTPKALLDSSEALTQVSMALQDHPELAAEGVEFYRACANHSDLMTAVRAVCLQRLIYGSKDSVPEQSAYPEELWNLAQGLPPLRRPILPQ
jgi:hypothetical protein